MNNLVAKHDFNKSSVHKDKKRAEKESNRKQKHKGQKYEY
ncbi:hypothetical protein AVV36_gp171 [Pectobacterium bacteriophage PM2]|uniref:Uncharacterized protein n=1 Tax=Pectobacterium bacteriophage PM2 TaxID=1429794 RepID=A0A0A0PZQ9_9CAUD|nr:hypothetical protein AVV36_gp171 [Pectobacterium bacteriophage PM2]AHY25239.1 hypothetical protein PM2_277 [Pectobacterium bacteriophage PM2]